MRALRRSAGVPASTILAIVVPLGFLLACETTPDQAPPPAAAQVPPDVNSAALCQMVAEVEDARSQGGARALRDRLEQGGADRVQRFGAMLAITDDQERFRAFRDDGAQHPHSPVGAIGLCFVYADWKMDDQAAGACRAADQLLAGAPVTDVARARLKRKHGAHDAGAALLDGALSRDPTCAAALIEAAHLAAARGEAELALAAWQRARAAWPACFTCAVEAAQLADASSDRSRAIPLWEAALALSPGSALALKQYAAALAASDPKRALGAYQRAVDAGAGDLPTLLGGAQLAAAAGDVAVGLAFAERAAVLQKDEIDAWRLVLALAQRRNDAAQGDPARAAAAAREVLRLVDEDVPALLLLARQARASGALVEAVVRYDAAARAIAAGRTAGAMPADLETAKAEHAALLKDLRVSAAPANGKAQAVVRQVQAAVQELFLERLKKKKGLKGTLEVVVVASESGAVDSVDIVNDTLGDDAVAASVVANLRRANITGGAKRYSFTMELK